jgi:hypothetical protein
VAGEISGLPPHSPPTTRPDYRLYLGNDFLASGTSDDFRTQQISVSGRFRDRWIGVADLSIFTDMEPDSGPAGRIDTFTLSFGYEVLRRLSERGQSSISAGIGVRSVGNFGGSRIQNGVHRLIISDIVTLPYSSSRQSNLSGWALAEHQQVLRPGSGAGWIRGWDLGYWARAGAFVTTDRQLDAVAGLYAMASRPGYELWLGVRHDWRRGYESLPVLASAADEEEKAALVLGARLGSLVIETVNRFDSAASYGQLSFVSSPETRREEKPAARADLQYGLHLPHMLSQFVVRLPGTLLTNSDSPWRTAYVIDLRAGQPQLGNDTSRFVETYQASLGLEWSRNIIAELDWLRIYGNVALGVRSEQLVGQVSLSGVDDDVINRGVLLGGFGVELTATSLGSRWQHALRLGLSGWFPASSVSASIGGSASTIQQSDASIVAAWTVNYR